MMNGLARSLSFLFHPFAVGLLTLGAATYAAGISPTAALGWLGFTVVGAFAPTVLFIAFGVRQGRYTDYDVSVREQRGSVALVSVVSLIILIALLRLLGGPPVLRHCLLAGMLGMAVNGLITRWVTKISGHAFAAGYATAILTLISPAAGAAMGLAALSVAWARIRLGHHTPVQVALGLAVGALSVWIVFAGAGGGR